MEENPTGQSLRKKLKLLLDSIQNLPERKRKIIFCFLAIIISLILLNIYFKSVGETLNKGVMFPDIQLPEIKIPEK